MNDPNLDAIREQALQTFRKHHARKRQLRILARTAAVCAVLFAGYVGFDAVKHEEDAGRSPNPEPPSIAKESHVLPPISSEEMLAAFPGASPDISRERNSDLKLSQ